MPGINLGADFNAELVTLAGWNPNTVDASTVGIAFVNQGGQSTVTATATSNVNTDDLNALIRKYVPGPDNAPTATT